MNISSPNSISPVTSQYNSLPLPVFTLNTINSSYVYPVENLPSTDYKTLMNLSNFEFTIVNKCTTTPLLLILIHTSPKNYERRKSIRETWGRNSSNVQVFFVFGATDDQDVQKKLEEENNNYSDIIQGTFLDSYRNMTYKHVMAFKYSIYHCPDAKYILKTDDDVFVNMPRMMDFLTVDLSPYGAKNLLSCSLTMNLLVIRTFRSKWRVSFKEYRDKYYPPYCLGWALLYSPDVLFALYQNIQKSKYFWIDDVLITGILAKQENIQHTNVQNLILPRNNLQEITEHESTFNGTNFIFGPPNLTTKEVHNLWNYIKSHSSNKYLIKDHR